MANANTSLRTVRISWIAGCLLSTLTICITLSEWLDNCLVWTIQVVQSQLSLLSTRNHTLRYDSAWSCLANSVEPILESSSYVENSHLILLYGQYVLTFWHVFESNYIVDPVLIDTLLCWMNQRIDDLDVVVLAVRDTHQVTLQKCKLSDALSFYLQGRCCWVCWLETGTNQTTIRVNTPDVAPCRIHFQLHDVLETGTLQSTQTTHAAETVNL